MAICTYKPVENELEWSAACVSDALRLALYAPTIEKIILRLRDLNDLDLVAPHDTRFVVEVVPLSAAPQPEQRRH